jgi:pilus assembly protein Flp/PilA
LTTLIRNLQARRKRDEGASAVEYGLLVALIAVVIAATVVLLGTALNTKFGAAEACVDSDAASACP